MPWRKRRTNLRDTSRAHQDSRSVIRKAAAIADRFEHRVPLSRVEHVQVQWGGYNSTFLVMPNTVQGKYPGAGQGTSSTVRGTVIDDANMKRLTVVFVGRIVRVVCWDNAANGIANPQRILFRVFRDADSGGARGLVYGCAEPSRRRSSNVPGLSVLISLQALSETRFTPADSALLGEQLAAASILVMYVSLASV